MQTYTVSKDAYQKLVKKRLAIVIPAIAVVMLTFLGLDFSTSRSTDIVYQAITTPLIMAFVGFIYYRAFRKQIRLVLSYTLTLSESEITREQNSTPTITINFMEVKEILKTKKGGFVIKGRTARDIINVPYLIENAADLEQRLQTFAPITATGRRLPYQQYIGLIYLTGVAAYITSILEKNIFLSIITGVVALAILIWLFITVRRSKNATDGMRRATWFYLYFAIMLTATLILKIMGFQFGKNL